jgi:hypothetical protein
MSFQGRSPDDLPLAAYSTGIVDDELDEEFNAEPAHPLTQQEAVALAMGIDAPAKPEPEPAAPTKRGSGRPRLSLPRPSLPKPTMPGLPRLGFRGRTAAVAESPFHLEPSTMSMSVAHMPAAAPMVAPMAAPVAASVAAPTARPRTPAAPGRSLRPGLGDLGTKLRDPRTAVRDPRVLFGGLIGVGVVLLGVSMLGGGNAGGLGADASPSAAPGFGGPAGPGPATVQVTGTIDSTFTLTGATGFGKPTDGLLASTWTDGAGTTLSISGRVGSGTRTTSADLIVSVTLVVNGAPVEFLSEDGECTVGMAAKMTNIVGSFNCKELSSVDRRIELKITGNYQT